MKPLPKRVRAAGRWWTVYRPHRIANCERHQCDFVWFPTKADPDAEEMACPKCGHKLVELNGLTEVPGSKIHIVRDLEGDLLRDVWAHELCHVAWYMANLGDDYTHATEEKIVSRLSLPYMALLLDNRL